MKTRYLFFLLAFLPLIACEDKIEISTQKLLTLHVRFVDFEQSCNWNLEIIDKILLYDFHGNYTSRFLHANIDDFNQDGAIQLGDELTVEFEVLPENPYPQRLIICDAPEGIPVRLISVQK